MDYKRIGLLIALAVISFSLWDTWQREHPAVITVPTTAAVANPSTAIAGGHTDVTTTASWASAGTSKEQVDSSQMIHITTDVLAVDIDLQGGDVIGVKLPLYPKKIDTPHEPVTLENIKPESFYIAQSGLLGTENSDSVVKNVRFKTTGTALNMVDGQDILQVDLEGLSQSGVKVTKSFLFKRGSYAINVNYLISNTSARPWNAKPVMQLVRTNNPPKSEGFLQPQAYFGASFSVPAKPYEKVSFKDMDKSRDKGNSGLFEKVSLYFTGTESTYSLPEQPITTQSLSAEPAKEGWIAMQEHYFLSAWVPDASQLSRYYYQVLSDNRYAIGLEGEAIHVAPGENHIVKSQLYVGPEIAKNLQAVAPRLDMTVDFGWFWFISVMIFWLMEKIYSVVNNWGWSIVLVTLFIKLIFYQLSAASYRSMANMRKVQPKIMALRERYADDKQKLNQSVMELYKKEKINPLGGCLPVLVQIPVFIALYWVLFESVELRQAHFIFWIKDLSVKDPYFILPVLFGITVFIQQKLSPPAPDPTQDKVRMILPVLMTLLFIELPAGLALYMFVNSGVSVIQQWHNMHRYDVLDEAKKQKTKSKKPAKELTKK